MAAAIVAGMINALPFVRQGSVRRGRLGTGDADASVMGGLAGR
jgi:hypothetical protein